MRNAIFLRGILAAFLLGGSVAACAPISGQQTAGEYVDDVTLSTQVRAAIIGELGLEGIGVETMDRVVQLSGFVDDATTKARAGEIAAGVSGVRRVRNDLVIQ